MTDRHDLEPLRRQLYEYYVAYYTKLRRLLHAEPAYRSDPEAFPYHLRDHPRVVRAAECADGYRVIHVTADEGENYSVKIDDKKHDWTVRELTRIDVPEHGDFFQGRIYITRKREDYWYAELKGREERVEAISYSQVATLTPDKARNEARSALRNFFEDPNSPFFKAQPDE